MKTSGYLVLAACLLACGWIPAKSAVDTEEKYSFVLRPQRITIPSQTLIPSPHTASPIIFSPDGKLIISSFEDCYLRVWNRNGYLLREFSVSSDTIVDMAFLRESADIVLVLKNGEIKQVDLNTGSVTRAFASGNRAAVIAAAFSDDRKKLLLGMASGDIELWDYAAGLRLKTKVAHKGPVSFVALRRDGTLLTASLISWSQSIKIWEQTGVGTEEIISQSPAQILTSSQSFDSAHTINQGVTDVDFTPSKDFVFTKYCAVAVSPDGQLFAGAHMQGVDIFDAEIKLIGTIKIQYEPGEYSLIGTAALKFSPDGKSLAFIPGSQSRVFFLKPDTVSQISAVSIPSPRHMAGPEGGAAFSPDSTQLAVTHSILLAERPIPGQSGKGGVMMTSLGISVFSAKRPALERTIQQIIDLPSEVEITSDGLHFVSVHGPFNVKVWDMAGKITTQVPEFAGGYAKNEAKMISARLYSPAPTREGLRRLLESFGKDGFTPFTFSKDDRLIAAYRWDAENTKNIWNGTVLLPVRIVDIVTGRLINQINLKYGHMIFDGSGKRLISSRGIVEISSGKLIRPFGDVLLVASSKLGKTIATAGENGIDILTVEGDYLRHLDVPGSPNIRLMEYDNSGERLAVCAGAGVIQLWNPETGKKIDELKGYDGRVISLGFSRDGKFLISAAEDFTIRLWNLSNKQSVSLLSRGDEWLMYTPDGYFDASPHGAELVAMVKNLEAFGVEQFAVLYNRPDLILERMGTGTPELTSYYYTQYQKRLRKLGFNEAGLSSELHVPEVRIDSAEREEKFITISFTASDSKYPLKSYSIFVNNVPVTPAHERDISKKTFTSREKIEMTPGKNKIEVSVINSVGAESYRALTYADYDGREKGDLYYLAFGTSKYKDPELNLNYADKDAKDLEDTILKMRPGYENVYTKVLLNSEVTAENIKKVKTFFKNAKTDDTVILFVAGHGGYDKGKDPGYYYLPYEADRANLTATGVEFETIEDILYDIKPRKKLFLLDTCESGELDENIYGQYYAMADARGLNPRTFRKPLKSRGDARLEPRPYLYEKDRFIYNNLARRSGAVVFSSSRGGEISYESSGIENGFFTEKVIAALTDTSADKDGNKAISLDELREYVSAAVAKETNGLQHPTVDRDNIYQKIELPLLAN